VFRQKLENVAKVLGQDVDIKGFDHFDRVLILVKDVDLLKVLMGDCWLGFRGDAPG
jgi:hypothetical protein